LLTIIGVSAGLVSSLLLAATQSWLGPTGRHRSASALPAVQGWHEIEEGNRLLIPVPRRPRCPQGEFFPDFFSTGDFLGSVLSVGVSRVGLCTQQSRRHRQKWRAWLPGALTWWVCLLVCWMIWTPRICGVPVIVNCWRAPGICCCVWNGFVPKHPVGSPRSRPAEPPPPGMGCGPV